MAQVLIVGAGPTGLTAALELSRLGQSVDIIEKRSGPSHLSRAVGIQARSMDILAASGAADGIAAEAVQFKGVMFHHHARRLNKLPLNFSEGSKLWGLAQDRTEFHLSEALAQYGVKVRYGVTFEGLTQDDTGVIATTNGSSNCYANVIGADGSHSAVRNALGLSFDGFDLPNEWSIADVDSPNWPDRGWFKGYLLDKGNVCIVAPLEDTRYRVISSTPDALKALPAEMDAANLRRADSFTISIRQVPKCNVGHVFLAGDAAHSHSPVGGRGMNLGIADAADLAARLATGDTAGYHKARHAAGAHVLAFSERGRRIMQSQNPLTRLAVLAAMRTFGKVPSLGKMALNQLVNG